MAHTRRSTWCSLRRLGPVRRCALLLRSGLCCEWCGIFLTQETAQIDHVVARALGGADTNDNLVAACADCNGQRGTEPRPRPPSLDRPVDLKAGRRLALAWYPFMAQRIEDNKRRKREARARRLKEVGRLDFPFGSAA